MSKSQYRLRSAERSDVENILFMIKQLAEYEKEPHSVEITERDLERDGFETQPPLFHVVLAEVLEQNGWKCVGFALWFYVYSTWQGKALHLEDLFVLPQYRNRGIGKALLRRCAQVALSEKCKRYQWNVLTWNTPSIDFYEAVGAKAMKEWMLMRMDKYSMERFIESSTDSVSKQ
ncbi:Diamine acetyltransferase 2 [Galdieria sulphuraria]|uniref:Diamine N-acetyltransferase n=1 Tax=Galdieria sulphuraria TaxID=130081 RepID=M2X1I9_GALSU|nr:diamine N-acetyltransferase [Galdieria sulphuraria]EME30225.1 diamine N-acetyltransferase [Galdieria sulphuraria]GJD08393.1 Diamine acetyltransferase 2 [Galdieria sulphuraria]|eukprot:XP_005706745.1 diamine N-acetyltransferase [Galdieria sulphuraria]